MYPHIKKLRMTITNDWGYWYLLKNVLAFLFYLSYKKNCFNFNFFPNQLIVTACQPVKGYFMPRG